MHLYLTYPPYMSVLIVSAFHLSICRLTSELQLTMGSTAESEHSRTLGSVITLGKWHHLSVSVLPVEMQPIYKVSFILVGMFTIILFVC